ncbi:unnamed protein product [Caenorhabditis bovis]|uniref:Uncharacterized protein n=1 Tax=Caenorhabditis bovis TaxID=2654633 RepID=A0A8S1EL38_9PELO|nr:unnamed protein product [Caenorhabditis bovis]
MGRDITVPAPSIMAQDSDHIQDSEVTEDTAMADTVAMEDMADTAAHFIFNQFVFMSLAFSMPLPQKAILQNIAPGHKSSTSEKIYLAIQQILATVPYEEVEEEIGTMNERIREVIMKKLENGLF